MNLEQEPLTFRPTSLSILIVDDTNIHLMYLERALIRDIGFKGTIETATNGKDALSLLKKKHFDLVLLD